MTVDQVCRSSLKMLDTKAAVYCGDPDTQVAAASQQRPASVGPNCISKLSFLLNDFEPG